MDEEVITLRSADGKELRFKAVASVPLEGRQFSVLAPEEPFPGMSDNQALVFEITGKNDETAAMNIVTDPYLINRVFDEYSAIMMRKTEEQARKK